MRRVHRHGLHCAHPADAAALDITQPEAALLLVAGEVWPGVRLEERGPERTVVGVDLLALLGSLPVAAEVEDPDQRQNPGEQVVVPENRERFAAAVIAPSSPPKCQRSNGLFAERIVRS